MSIQGSGYGVECTVIRQSLQEVREPIGPNHNLIYFYKNSQDLPLSSTKNFSNLQLQAHEHRFKSRLQSIYTRMKLFSRRDNKNKPSKDRSGRVFPNKSFRIKEDTSEEIANTRTQVWNSFSHRFSRTKTRLHDVWCSRSVSPAPTDYSGLSAHSPPF